MLALKCKVDIEECTECLELFLRCDLLLAVVGSVDQVVGDRILDEVSLLVTAVTDNFLDLLRG